MPKVSFVLLIMNIVPSVYVCVGELCGGYSLLESSGCRCTTPTSSVAPKPVEVRYAVSGLLSR